MLRGSVGTTLAVTLCSFIPGGTASTGQIDEGLSIPTPSIVPSNPSFPLRIVSARAVGRDLEFGRIISRTLGPDGSVYVADMLNHTITRLTSDGEVEWQIGGAGEGPGEFQVLYRVAVRQDGHVLAFDRTTNQITEFAPDGTFVQREQLGLLLLQVDDIVILEENHVMISGTTPITSRYAGRGIHSFDPDLHHLRSFGPVPEAEDPRLLEFWGAGTLSVTPSGDALFTRRTPYEVYRYDLNGTEKGRIAYAYPVAGGPDDAYRLEGDGAGFSIERSEIPVTRLLRTIELAEEMYLGVTRTSGEPVILHGFTSEGESLGTLSLDMEWGGIIGYDRSRSVLWFSGFQDMEPVLWRVEVEFA